MPYGWTMFKMQLDVVVHAKPIFYKSCVVDTYARRKRNAVDKLFEELNSYNRNIKLTFEINPEKFLDTELIRENGEITIQVFSKSIKLPLRWSLKIPVRYKVQRKPVYWHILRIVAVFQC